MEFGVRMNRYKPNGWRMDSHRHSLAAKGVKTSFLMMVPYPGWAVNAGRTRPINPSRKQLVESEISWVKAALADLTPPPEGITEERRQELMAKLTELERIRAELVKPGRRSGSMMSEFQKEARQRQFQRVLSDERAQKRLLNRIDNLILEAKNGNVEGDLLTEEVLTGFGRGRSSNPLDYAAKKTQTNTNIDKGEY